MEIFCSKDTNYVAKIGEVEIFCSKKDNNGNNLLQYDQTGRLQARTREDTGSAPGLFMVVAKKPLLHIPDN